MAKRKKTTKKSKNTEESPVDAQTSIDASKSMEKVEERPGRLKLSLPKKNTKDAARVAPQPSATVNMEVQSNPQPSKTAEQTPYKADSLPTSSKKTSEQAGVAAAGNKVPSDKALIKKRKTRGPNKPKANNAKNQKKDAKHQGPDGHSDATSIRTSPSILKGVVSTLSRDQKIWLERTGLGVFLKFKLDTLPHRMGFKVVKSLNPARMQLILNSGSIDIDEMDVHEVLGLPRGDEDIDLEDYADPMHEAWVSQFKLSEENRFRISTSLVTKKIEDEENVTDCFKWNFLLILYNSLIEPSSTGQVQRRILNFTGDIDNLSKYNWCKLVVDKIHSCKLEWDVDKSFTGPLVFLILLYVDRVCIGRKRTTPRTNPVWLSWTSQLLQERNMLEEKNGWFGEGLISKPIWADSQNIASMPINPDTTHPQVHPNLAHNQPTGTTATFEEVILQKIEASTTRLMECVLEYNGCMQTCSEVAKTHPRIKAIQDSVRNAFKSLPTFDLDTPPSSTHVNPGNTHQNDKNTVPQLRSKKRKGASDGMDTVHT